MKMNSNLFAEPSNRRGRGNRGVVHTAVVRPGILRQHSRQTVLEHVGQLAEARHARPQDILVLPRKSRPPKYFLTASPPRPQLCYDGIHFLRSSFLTFNPALLRFGYEIPQCTGKGASQVKKLRFIENSTRRTNVTISCGGRP